VDAGNMFGSVSSSALNLFLMSNNAFLFIRALQSQGALRALAEPNLVAMNGQQASFLAGGEIPIPVVQGVGGGGGGGVTLQYKEYGVRINFKPNILDEDHIRLELEPEVSTLDYANSVQLNGFRVPALRTRKAKTAIELRDGQSFALAGLLDNNEVQSLAKVPWLGSVPFFGTLFTSKQFQKQETELVFFVTAQITKPVNPDSVPQMRGLDGLKGGSPLADRPPDPAVRSRTTKSTLKTEPGPAVPTSTPAIEAPTLPTLVPQRVPNPEGKVAPTTKTALPKETATRARETAVAPDLRALEKLVWRITVPELKEPSVPTQQSSQVRREK
jgi:pilus assembly protein CpaC